MTAPIDPGTPEQLAGIPLLCILGRRGVALFLSVVKMCVGSFSKPHHGAQISSSMVVIGAVALFVGGAQPSSFP